MKWNNLKPLKYNWAGRLWTFLSFFRACFLYRFVPFSLLLLLFRASSESSVLFAVVFIALSNTHLECCPSFPATKTKVVHFGRQIKIGPEWRVRVPLCIGFHFMFKSCAHSKLNFLFPFVQFFQLLSFHFLFADEKNALIRIGKYFNIYRQRPEITVKSICQAINYVFSFHWNTVVAADAAAAPVVVDLSSRNTKQTVARAEMRVCVYNFYLSKHGTMNRRPSPKTLFALFDFCCPPSRTFTTIQQQQPQNGSTHT